MSEYSQKSFSGGMDLHADDTRLQPNQYRCGLNVRNRFDVLEPIPVGVRDPAVPDGLKQELVTFGNFVILFAGGRAFYKYYTDTGWRVIAGFAMSVDAPRYWTCPIPLGTTNYVRVATDTSAYSNIKLNSVAGAFAGNLPGLLVQDNINQPMFIFLDAAGVPKCRITQSYTQWSIKYTDATNTVVARDGNNQLLDNREYVPIGNCMALVDGVLFTVSQDFNTLYRSVSGRPLDFVVNVTNHLATNAGNQTFTYINPITNQSIDVVVPPYTSIGGGAYDTSAYFQGGDATTTSYSVGVGGVSCVRQAVSGGLFVSASNSNFIITRNMANNAPLLFGEYLFLRTFLFNATNLSDRSIVDSLGDTRVIDLIGVVSFNATKALANEGRNSVFSTTVQSLFKDKIQDARYSAAILFDNYELYAVNTVLGNVILVFDTVNACWTSIDTSQVDGKRIKAFAKIELTIQRLYAITEDDQLYTLYIGTENATSYMRTVAVNYVAQSTTGETVKMSEPKQIVKLTNVRATINNITDDTSLAVQPIVDNRAQSTQTKPIKYLPPTNAYTGPMALPDMDTMLFNAFYSFPNALQGWKCSLILSWNAGSLTQFSMVLQDITPMNPSKSQ